MSEQIKADFEQVSENRLEQIIDSMGEVTIHFNGISMRPMLRDKKDLVVIQKVTRPLLKYDVPVYRMPSGKILLHRIIKIKNGKYIIRGDNNMFNEYNVTDDMIFGVLKGFYRDREYIDCKTNKWYKLYVFVNTHTFTIRKIWRKYLRPFASKIKHTIFK